jgi:DNA-binding response OmpR family regulator
MSLKPNMSGPTGKHFRKQLDNITRRKLSENKVVSLSAFRDIKKSKQKLTVLVVDDEEIMRNALKRVLEGEHYNVLLAEDGYALSHFLETTILDVILLDVNLPWVDGFELVHLIKSHSVLKDVPVIMVSGRKSTEDIQRAMALGANDFIAKPFDVDFLLNSIKKNLQSAG